VTIPTDRSQVSPSSDEIRTRSRQQPAAGRKRNMMCRDRRWWWREGRDGTVRPKGWSLHHLVTRSQRRGPHPHKDSGSVRDRVGQHEVHRSAEPISQSHPGSIPPWLPRTRHLPGAASRPSAPTSSPRSAGRCSVHRSGWWCAEQCMSANSTTRQRRSLRSRFLHSATRSDETSPLRPARLIADLTSGITQHTPRQTPRLPV